MAKDVQDTVRDVLRALEGVGNNGRGKSGGGLSGVKGVAAGAGAAALAPLAVKGAGRLVKGIGSDGLGSVVHAPQHALHDATSKLGSSIGDKVSDKVDEAGGPSGILKSTVKDALPFGGDDDDDDDQGGDAKNGTPGVGKGRRMPVQQSVDIGVNIETVYNQFTQFEEWPNFMHRVTRVTQDDDEATVKFATKIWGKTKEFTADIETQRPDERIKWSVSQGMTHTGVVTFHELGPHLTRLLLTMDVDPGSLIEKAARGMRHVKRAARADLHRFKAFIEMNEQETGAWRGVIEDGEVVEEHDAGYDEDRDYTDLDEIIGARDQDENDDGQDENDQEQDESDEEEEKPRQRRGRAQSRSAATSSSGQSRTSRSGGQSRSNSSGSQSRSRNAQSRGSSRSRAGASGGQSRQRQTRSRNGHGE
jgi:uncharacterized membrane protein